MIAQQLDAFFGFGHLAQRYGCGNLPLKVLSSAAGYYIGTVDDDGPISRESAEYFKTKPQAQQALESGVWAQRLNLISD